MLYILLFLFIILVLYLFLLSKERPSNIFDTYFGVPGSGKSTQSAKIVSKYLKKNIKCYSNFDIKGCYQLNIDDLGVKVFKNCVLIIDEVGIDMNNRDFKTNMPKHRLSFFKKHRHYNVDIFIFSQSYNDMDLKLRTLSTRFFLMKKSFIPFTFSKRQIKKYIGINKFDQSINDMYDFVPFSLRFTYGPNYWKYFDSYDTNDTLIENDIPLW